MVTGANECRDVGKVIPAVVVARGAGGCGWTTTAVEGGG